MPATATGPLLVTRSVLTRGALIEAVPDSPHDFALSWSVPQRAGRLIEACERVPPLMIPSLACRPLAFPIGHG